MASSTTPFSAKRDLGAKAGPSLLDRLSNVLPKGHKFGVYHLSTPPTRTDALFSAPPNERPDKTYCEYHFLAISIDAPKQLGAEGEPATPTIANKVLVLALEVYIFTTAYTTTIFVSKADSTGYLSLLNLPKGTPSPIKEVSSTFLAHLVEHRRRRDIQTVVTLFARAQAQYLFPGSVEYKGKHVLDDSGLVKWWCRVLNPLLESASERKRWADIKGYLIVPGLERIETRAYLPRTPASVSNWVLGHPMERISHYTREYDWVPPRCLIPRFPDDPKSRFRDELDEEASKWKQDTGAWKSVRTLDQFWEMMAFRQECTSGHLTGFIWLVFDPIGLSLGSSQQNSSALVLTPSSSFDASSLPPSQTQSQQSLPPSTPPKRRVDISATTPHSSPLKLSALPGSADSTPSKRGAAMSEKKKKKRKKLKGAIVPRQPHVKRRQRNYLLERPTSTAYYHWPSEARGEKIVDESDYKRIVELLLHLNFSDLEKATIATRRWISEVGMGSKWGQEAVGKREAPAATSRAEGNASAGGVTNLTGMIRRKRPAENEANGTSGAAVAATDGVNVLGAGLVRKKRKDDDAGTDSLTEPDSANGAAITEAPKVNVLGSGFIRKKPKAA